MDTQKALAQCLVAALSPTRLEITDLSHLHKGHPGAQSGGKHFKVKIACQAFNGLALIDCHKKVYEAAANLLKDTQIHALQVVVER